MMKYELYLITVNIVENWVYDEVRISVWGKKVVCSLAPHFPTMKSLWIYEEVDKIFTKAGIENWVNVMSRGNLQLPSD